jgi:hypothetical protein
MALHFVSSSILTSTDGVDFNEEVTIDTEETRRQKIKAEQDSKKSLYDQLREKQAAKDDEFESTRKAMYQPGKLDEEDVAYIEELERKQKKINSSRLEHEERLLEEFRSAKCSVNVAVSASSSSTAGAASNSSIQDLLAFPPPKSEEPAVSVTFIKKKRRLEVESGPPAPAHAPAPAPVSALSGLAAYGSDDDE